MDFIKTFIKIMRAVLPPAGQALSCELTITTRRSYKLGNKEQHKERNTVFET